MRYFIVLPLVLCESHVSPCFFLSGSSFQQLQPLKPSENVSAGGTVTMSCTFSSGTISDGNYPCWVQQRLGQGPRGLIYHTSNRVPGIPDRFIGSKSGNTMSLTIRGVRAEDEADYYCAVWSGSGWAQLCIHMGK